MRRWFQGVNETERTAPKCRWFGVPNGVLGVQIKNLINHLMKDGGQISWSFVHVRLLVSTRTSSKRGSDPSNPVPPCPRHHAARVPRSLHQPENHPVPRPGWA